MSQAPQTKPKPARRPASFSPTAIDSFLGCPKQYEYSYIEKPKVAEAPSPHLVFGNACHQALAHLYRLPEEDRILENAQKALRHFWARISDRHEAFLDEEDERAWGIRALESLADYCGRYELSIRPLAVEDWVRARLPNGRMVVGKADRVDRARGLDRGIEVVDYKTGKCRIEDDEVRELLAARLYALAATRTFFQPVVRVRFIFITEGVERSWAPQNEDLAAIEDELVELTDRISDTDTFLAQPDPWRCRWCRYGSICPAKDETSVDELTDAGGAPF
jgi:putative RecB family exonuclease